MIHEMWRVVVDLPLMYENGSNVHPKQIFPHAPSSIRLSRHPLPRPPRQYGRIRDLCYFGPRGLLVTLPHVP